VHRISPYLSINPIATPICFACFQFILTANDDDGKKKITPTILEESSALIWAC